MAAAAPKPKDIQKSTELTKVVLTVFMPGCHCARTPPARSSGLIRNVAAIAANEPMIAQKGSTMPVSTMPGSITRPVGTAGSRPSVIVVVSRYGWGMR